MDTMSGIGKKDRARLSAVARNAKGAIRADDVARILDIDKVSAAKMLARWSKKGWISRILHGLYIIVPIESSTSNIPIEEPWVIAKSIFSPCYIGGWTAAEYWDLTEQIFYSILVITSKNISIRELSVRNIKFVIRTVPDKLFFGLKSVWRGSERLNISDPSRTILDLLIAPKLAGGIRPVADIFNNYLKSKHNDLQLLLEYSSRQSKGVVYKRLGFLLEKYAPTETDAIAQCKRSLTKGYSNLDPELPSDRIVSRWRLRVPDNWIKEK